MEPGISLLLFMGGILAGLYASNVGGGSLVTFPLLIIAGLPTHMAIATNRLSSVFLEGAGAIRFHVGKKLDLGFGLKLGAVAATGSVIGSSIVITLDENLLELVIAFIFAAIFVVLSKNRDFGMKEAAGKGRDGLLITFSAFILGIYGGFFGAGFGTFIMFLLVWAGLDFVKSAGLGRAIGLIMSLAATAVFALNGMIDYPYALALGSGCAIGSWAGVSIGVKKGNAYIRGLFTILIILSTIRLLLGAFDVQI